jgi:hypothetical protein
MANGDLSTDEYNSLRDETLKRVEFRNNLFNFTIITAGTIITVSTERDIPIAMLAYPILILFFASSYSYNTMLLITLGSYLREHVERGESGFGWASYLKDKYRTIEHLERVAKYGLFVVTPLLMLAFTYFRYGSRFGAPEWGVLVAGLIAILLTIGVLAYPEYYHHKALSGPPAERPGAGRGGA